MLVREGRGICLFVFSGICSVQKSGSGVGTTPSSQNDWVTGDPPPPPPVPDTLEIVKLSDNRNVLVLPDKEESDDVAEACEHYVSKPAVIKNDTTLKSLADALKDVKMSDESGVWVGIKGFTPVTFFSNCVANRDLDHAVCFKSFITFLQKHFNCFTKVVELGRYTLDLSNDGCHVEHFRPVCENGLACGEGPDKEVCGVWLKDCPLHGSCKEKEAAALTWDMKCRYSSPTLRLLQYKGSDEHFHVSCDIVEGCLKQSMATPWSLLPNVSFRFYKDGSVLGDYQDSHTLKVSKLQKDSSFQCHYNVNDVPSTKSPAISKPEFVPVKKEVRAGDSVEFTCKDSGTENLPSGGEPVLFEWRFPSGSDKTTPIDTYTIENFADGDAGRYRCRTLLDGTPSVWSEEVWLTIKYDDPVLTATPNDLSKGSTVTLSCSTHGHTGFTYVFFKDGTAFNDGSSLPQMLINNFSPLEEGNYQCSILFNKAVVGSSNVVALSMKPPQPPQVLQAPELTSDTGRAVREGQSVKLTCTESQDYQERLEYFFYFKSSVDNSRSEMSSGSTRDIIIPSFSTDRQGTYTCGFSIAGNDPAIHTTQISTESKAIVLDLVTAVLLSTATNVPEGSDVELVCSVTNYDGPVESFAWLVGDLGTVVYTSSKNSTTINNFQSQYDGVYRCQAILSHPLMVGPPLTSHPLTLVSVSRYQTCRCMCSNLSLSVQAPTPAVIEEVTQAIQKNLSVNKDKLSSNIRRVTSSPDNRPMSKSAGYVAVVLLSLVAGLFIIPDFVCAVLALFDWIYTGQVRTRESCAA